MSRRRGIGTTGGQMVEARLFCDGVQHDTGLVPLEADGDFAINDVLTPTPPSPCNHPVLLIVNAGNLWFDEAVLIPARELAPVRARLGMRGAVGVAFERDGRDLDDRRLSEPPLQVLVPRLAFGQPEPPAVVVDHDLHVVG